MSELKRTQQAIHEGFICSKCMRSFSGVPELLVHYEKCQEKPDGFGEGGGSGKDNNSFKGFLGKAKQKLLQEPGRFLDSQLSSQQGRGGDDDFRREKVTPSGIPKYFNSFQNVEVKGVSQSHFHEFKKIRSGRLERYVSEANKLKIRLSKLVQGLEKFPNLLSKSTSALIDSTEWKAHEKSVVFWLDEKPVTRCPECTQSFNILKRKHHCRLCGSVICQDCSLFVPLRDAVEMYEISTSLNREFVASSSIAFRVCYYCSHLIKYDTGGDKRLTQGLTSLDGAAPTSPEGRLLNLYQSLKEKMEEINQLQPQLVTMVTSIQSGDALYSRDEANMLRSKLLRISEQIDIVSKQISALRGANDQDTVSHSQIFLQQRIRQTCVAFIREFISKLPSVPDEVSSDTLSISSGCSTPQMQMEVLDDGWCIVAPTHHEHDHSGQEGDGADENPIQLQIRNVKFYIEQARAAGKHEEVEMLEASLADLIIWEQESKKK